MLSKLLMFLKLPGSEKKAFLEAFITLGIMRALILTVPFKKLTKSLKQQQKYEIFTLTSVDHALILAVRKAIKQAANHTPWESACLAQSLTARRMLQRRGVPGVFYLGVKKDNIGDKKTFNMKAHSWSQCGEMIVTGDKGVEDFTVVSVFAWDKQ